MAQPRWLNAREARAWRSYLRMKTELTAHLSRQLQSDSGMSEADFDVLVHLSEAPDGRLRLFELGETLRWEKSRVSHHLKRMENRGLVVREECADDARGAYVVVTATGVTAIEDAAPLHVDAVRAAFIDVLTPKQLEALADMADAVLDRLAELPGRD